MKKKIIAIVLVSGLAMATAASANWGRGGGPGAGNCGGYMQGAYSQQLDPAVQEKMDKFYQETQDLRRQMVVKRAEQRALMQGNNPDPAAAAKLSGDLFDLQTSMHDKAVAAGVDQYIGPMMFGGGRGPGMGFGGGRGGRMGGPRF